MNTATVRHELPPFSHPVKVAQISATQSTVRLAASPEECLGLAALWNVLSVTSLKAELQIARWKKDGVRIKGQVEAVITQACVVTLEPVDATIDETIDQIFVPEGSKLARIAAEEAAQAILDPDAPDLPDLFTGDVLDLGVIVAEFAALGIDPYPRKADIDFAGHIEDDGAKDAKRSPFAALKDWKKD